MTTTPTASPAALASLKTLVKETQDWTPDAAEGSRTDGSACDISAVRVPGEGLMSLMSLLSQEWPTPDPAVYHGLAGDIVRAIEPHTEADPVALLIQMLVCFGNSIGRSAHFLAEADKHYGNLYTVLVGVSSKGRKGTSWGHVRKRFGDADPAWAATCLASGLSSGEGLIWQVRDPIEKTVTDKKTGATSVEVVDAGVSDKRLLVQESEFASVLKTSGRDSNILSAIMRNAWDTGELQTLTKNSPARATGAHISAIGHITRDELRRTLDSTEAANGFANRFLWVCVRRSKQLPEGGDIESVDFGPMAAELRAGLAFAKGAGQVQRDPEARAAWIAVYPALSAGGHGLMGAVTSRAEAQVMRLALLYALLDRSGVIRHDHLRAALALWEYCEESARFIFGDSLGDPVADDILRALRAAAAGLTRTDLRDLLGRHQSSGRIEQALTLLAQAGQVRGFREATEGRPSERWFAAEKAPDDTAT